MNITGVSCPFCACEERLCSNALAYARFDKFPVNRGHVLIMPLRHVADFFETTPEEKQAMLNLLEDAKALLDAQFHPDGYNFGVKFGEAAGQTIFHVHLHLIPRYRGDVEHPRGGVRGVIPSQQNY
jgi:diadenosine tetraphosphate (Ap4A) HIT family hydrolase